MYLNKSDFKKTCQELLGDLDGILSWQWDRKSRVLVAEFPTSKEKEVRAVLERHLIQKWDSESINDVPENIKTATGDFNDLRAGQLIFTSDPDIHDLVFAVWWPWGNGEVVSMRIASPSTEESLAAENQSIFSKILGFFN
jgi:hypothetical protein